MRVLALDPGPEKTAWVLYHPEMRFAEGGCEVLGSENQDVNRQLRALIDHADRVVCEGIQSYGMPVGRTTFDTAMWIGRYQEYAEMVIGIEFEILYNPEVRLHLCRSSRAKDAHVRRALLDRYPETGGGATPQIGTKKLPGPLFGFKEHMWSALAVAVAWDEQRRANNATM